jgi:hypothetical protein
MIIEVLYILIIVASGLAIPNLFVSHRQGLHHKTLQLLWIFHLIISLAFYYFTKDGGGDAWGYWKTARQMSSESFKSYIFEAKGTYFMYAVNYVPARILGMGFLSNTLLFSLLGFVGIICFYMTAIKLVPYNTKFKGKSLFPLIFFMPNLHFWSSGVGKDTILFFCIGLITFGLLNIARRMPILIVGLVLSYLIRPHITLFLVLSFGLAYLFSGQISPFKRTIFTIILIGGGLVILPTVMEFAKIEESSVESFNKFSANKAAVLSRSHSGSAIDISTYPFPLKVFTFLYRPFFFDIKGLPAVIASVENLLLLLLSIEIFRTKPLLTFKSCPLVLKGLLIFFVIGTLAFSQTLGNVGIMIRMRNMFLPGMLMYILWSFSFQKSRGFPIKKFTPVTSPS